MDKPKRTPEDYDAVSVRVPTLAVAIYGVLCRAGFPIYQDPEQILALHFVALLISKISAKPGITDEDLLGGYKLILHELDEPNIAPFRTYMEGIIDHLKAKDSKR